MWILTTPWMLLGLAGVPLLVGIYLLRSRARRKAVSSLLLWADQKHARQGGRRVERLQTPLLFLLELLIIALLVSAATGPRARRRDTVWPTVLVLDDSYSMTAGGEQSARKRAVAALKGGLVDEAGFPMRLIVAGPRPELLAQTVFTPSQAEASLAAWKCGSASADLEAAIALAEAVAETQTRILVLTDHAPPEPLGPGRLRWLSFGTPRENVAIAHAARTEHDGETRLLVELANLGHMPVTTPLEIATAPLQVAPDGQPPADPFQAAPSRVRSLARASHTIAPGETLQLIWRLAPGDNALLIETPPDDLPMDNRVILLAPNNRPVRTRVAIHDPILRERVETALEATQQTVSASDRVDLLVTDHTVGAAPIDPATWRVRFIVDRGEGAASYTGPFVIDSAHPLAEGLGLDGVVWGTSPPETERGIPLIAAGNVILMSEIARRGGQRDIEIRFTPELSTLAESPNWPILWSNLVRLRAANKPGLVSNHIRLGSEASYINGADTTEATLWSAGGRQTVVDPRDGRVMFRPMEVGYHELRTSEGREPLTVSARNRDESDLRFAATGEWGSWLDERAVREEYRGWAWALILTGLALLMLHLALLASTPQGGRA